MSTLKLSNTKVQSTTYEAASSKLLLLKAKIKKRKNVKNILTSNDLMI